MRRLRPATLLASGILLIAWASAINGSADGPEKADRALLLFSPARGDAAARKKIPAAYFNGRLCPLEKELFADASDGRLDEFSLLEAALVANGVENAEGLQRYRSRLDGLIAELRGSEELAGPPRRRAQIVFEFMHCRILHGGYCLDCTDLRETLDQGRFNCVSASVLFGCLAGRLGLRVCGLEIPSHAMSRVSLPDGPLDIETTCPRWFRLMEDRKRQAELIEKTIHRQPSQDRAEPREITPVQMTAMIYYNRGVDLLAKRRFEQAAVANAKALWLDPRSTTAWGNLLATLNNWAIWLGNSGAHAEAAELLRQGLALEPSYETFALNYAHVHDQWVEALCRAGRFEEALEVLARAAAEMPD